MAKRAGSASERVFHPDGGMRVMYRMSRQEAESLADRGAVDREYDKISGRQLGYRVAGGARDKVDGELRSVFMAAAIDLAQMERNAECGRRFSLRRMEHAAAAVPEESLAARVQAKIFVYPHVGPERGAILTAWPL